MERIYRRIKRKQYKIRVISRNKNNYNFYGISVPRIIAKKFEGCCLSFNLDSNNSRFIVESGACLLPKIKEDFPNNNLAGGKIDV